MTVSLFNQFKRSLDTDVSDIRSEFIELMIERALSFTLDEDAEIDDRGMTIDHSTISLTIKRSDFDWFTQEVLGITDKDGMRRPTE